MQVFLDVLSRNRKGRAGYSPIGKGMTSEVGSRYKNEPYKDQKGPLGKLRLDYKTDPLFFSKPSHD